MIYSEDLPALNATADDVMKGAGGVYAGLAGHAGNFIRYGPGSGALLFQMSRAIRQPVPGLRW